MDIDIDLEPDADPTKIFRKIIPASQVKDGELTKHNVGYYFQEMPVDSITGFAAIPYKHSEEFGYYKIDLLKVNILKHFNSKEEMRQLAKLEPDWTLLRKQSVVKKLFHLGNHYDVVSKVQPTTVQELADVFALIRPHKKILIDKYIKNPKKLRPELYTKRQAGDMRKAHAIAYALLIVLQLHLIKQGRL